MARIFVTGSTDGLGLATAQSLLDAGHEVIVHARSERRLSAVKGLVDRGAVGVVGDLSDMAQTRDLADQVNRSGPADAIIHNAGVLKRPPHISGQRCGAVPSDRPHPPPAPPDLPQQRNAPGRSPGQFPRRSRGRRCSTGVLFGQQAVRHRARCGSRPVMA